MDTKGIRELAEILRDHHLQRISVSEGTISICIEAKGSVSAAATGSGAACVSSAGPEENGAVSLSASAGTVKSPLVGTVYLKADPEAAPYVSVGSVVQKGDVLCLVEAMKMYNDICADRSGTVKEICVVNGQSVDYGQALFVIEE